METIPGVFSNRYDDCISSTIAPSSYFDEKQDEGQRPVLMKQLNLKRLNSKRKTPHESCGNHSISRVTVKPFNTLDFNFLKIPDLRETLAQYGPHSLLVNKSPMAYGHSLLVPYIADCMPQVLEGRGLAVAFEFLQHCVREDVCIGFNSLGGFASVNHLHFQVW